MERYDFRTQRLFVDTPLAIGAELSADRGQANYLLNVLRLRDGAKVLLFNGRDGEWLAMVRPEGRKACRLEVVEQTREQPEPGPLTYCFAPLKSGRLDYMVQKAVEMGVSVLQPVITQYTQVTRINIDRMRANAIEAAEQCGILSVPECLSPLKLPELLDGWPDARLLVFADECAASENPVRSLSAVQPDSQKALLIGPEGGFSDEEREMLHARSFVHPIALGPRVLRADTAAVAALAAIQAACGDW